jgi:predicted amidophosphoribosyltransferase
MSFKKNKNVLPILRSFVRATFKSGAEIDLLVFLHSNVKRQFSPAQVASIFEQEEQEVEKSLMRLEYKGLLRRSGMSFKYQPKTSLASALANLLAIHYRANKLQIIRFIYED